MKTLKRLKTALLATMLIQNLTVQAFAAEGASYQILSEKSPVSFLAVGKPGFLRIKGQGAFLQGVAELKDGKLSGKFLVPLAGLKTGISLRDTHMHEKYLETKKFPQAELIINPFTLVKDEEKVPFTGMLTIKETSKPINGEVQILGLSEQATGKAEFKVVINDFPSIGVPGYLGVTVAEEVQVVVEFEAAVMAAVK
jgi:polyisoprenoid-binding protein YceI